MLKTPTTQAEEEAENSTGGPSKEENQELQLPEGDAADSAAEFTLVPSLGVVGFCLFLFPPVLTVIFSCLHRLVLLFGKTSKMSKR